MACFGRRAKITTADYRRLSARALGVPGAVLAVLAVSSPSPAYAETWAREGRLLRGPVLAGDGAVWAETGVDDGGLRVRAGAADGKTITLANFPGDRSGCQFAEDLAASATRVALVRRIAIAGGSGCHTSRWEFYVGTPDSPLRLLEQSGVGGSCGPPELVDIERDELLAIRRGCDGREITIEDLRTGTTIQTLPVPEIGEIIDVDRSGRYIAYHGREVRRDGARSAWIAVSRETGSEIYRYDVLPLLDPRFAPINYELRLRVDVDGTAVVRVPRYTDGALARDSLFFMNPREPRPHAIPVPSGSAAPASYSTDFGLQGGRIALAQVADAEGSVIDLAGRAVNVFDRPVGGPVDFDGTRLVWAGATIRSEAFPVAPRGLGSASLAAGAARLITRDLVARANGGLAAPLVCRLARGCRGRLIIATPRGTTLASARVALRRRQRTLVGLSLRKPARRKLQRERALAVNVRLVLPGRRPSVASAMMRLREAPPSRLDRRAP